MGFYRKNEYPRQFKSKRVYIASGLNETIDEFLLTEQARKLGFKKKQDVLNTALRDFFIKYEFINDIKKRT